MALQVSKPLPHLRLIVDTKAKVVSLMCQHCPVNIHGSLDKYGEKEMKAFAAKHMKCPNPGQRYDFGT